MQLSANQPWRRHRRLLPRCQLQHQLQYRTNSLGLPHRRNLSPCAVPCPSHNCRKSTYTCLKLQLTDSSVHFNGGPATAVYFLQLQLSHGNCGEYQKRQSPANNSSQWLATSQLQQEAQLMLTNLRDAFSGQSRSPNIVLFHMLGIVSYRAIVSLS